MFNEWAKTDRGSVTHIPDRATFVRALNMSKRSAPSTSRTTWKRRKTNSAALKRAYEAADAYIRSRVVRPSLQVINYKWTSNGIGVSFNQGGATYLVTAYARGSGEDQRKGAETLTYKMGIDLAIRPQDAVMKYCNYSNPFGFLVYDSQPDGTKPEPKNIFDIGTGFEDHPCTWKVQRALCNRFVVKRRWAFKLQTNGATASVDYSNKPINPCMTNVYFHKFVKRLGVRTEWKNTTGGDIGDIQKGALYFIMAPASGVAFVAKGNIRMYYKSVGNQ